MPLRLPLLGTAVILSGGAVLTLRQVRRTRADTTTTDDGPETPLPQRLAAARRRVAERLQALADLKLSLWHHTLPDFATLRARLQGLSGREAVLWLPSPPLALAPPDPDALRRMRLIGAELDTWDRHAPPDTSWEDRLDPLDLADLAARGIAPDHEAARDGQTDCPSLAWILTPTETTDGALFGGVGREAPALLAVLRATERVLDAVLEALADLQARTHLLLGELAVQLHVNPDYDRMADLPLPGEWESPRRRVERGHHLAAVLLALLEAPLLEADGRLAPTLPPLLDAHGWVKGRG